MSEWHGPAVDEVADTTIVESHPRFRGQVWEVRSDVIDFAGQRVVRDLMVHPGAVGVIALDDDDRVLLIRQYRHPVGWYLFEPPAGLLDKPGEDPLLAAQRELVEEAGYTADEWYLLVDFANSPGGSSETFRCYLARGLHPLESGRVITGEAEEMDLPHAWVPLDEARDAVLAGQLQNPTTVIGVLAAWSSRQTGWDTLRPTHSPWPIRDVVVATGRTNRLADE